MSDEAERSEFESWARRHGYLMERATNGRYAWDATDEAYKTWRAGRLSLTADQPADSAMTAEQIEALAHRKAWRYKHSSDPAHSDTYTFNRATLLEFARALVAKETPHAR